jgi:hypothetical protein
MPIITERKKSEYGKRKLLMTMADYLDHIQPCKYVLSVADRLSKYESPPPLFCGSSAGRSTGEAMCNFLDTELCR